MPLNLGLGREAGIFYFSNASSARGVHSFRVFV